MTKTIGLFLLFLSVSLTSFADEYNSRLRRISLLLTGDRPSHQDLVSLSQLPLNQKESYILDKIKEYQNHENFIQKMIERIEGLIQVRTSYHGHIFENGSVADTEESELGSMHHLIYDLIEQNKSWDNLLTDQEYSFSYDYDEDDPRNIQDIEFYAYNYGFTKERKEILQTYIRENAKLKSRTKLYPGRDNEIGRENLAGIITTNRFFSRYPTTRINKNLKRSAAIFRIFLCDAMTPAVLPSKDENSALLDMALGLSDGLGSHSLTAEEKHGTDPQCMACHHKIKPAADTFMGSGVAPNKYPSPGRLVYYETDEKGRQTKIDIPVSGLRELGEVITQQKTYTQCQVSHFWNWFIGKDIHLSFKQKEELSQKFDSLGRKPKEFISHLLSMDEFKNPRTLVPQEINYTHVQPILKRCDSCHIKEPLAPMLSRSYPFSSDQKINSYVLGQLIWTTDLRHEQSKPNMPPQNAGWKLKGYELDLLKAWIKNGAKDSQGNVYIKPDELRITDIHYDPDFLVKNSLHFHDTSERFMNNYDLISTMKTLYGDSYDYCTNIKDEVELMFFGFRSPSNGKALFRSPQAALLDWLRACPAQYLHSSNFQKFVPESLKDLGVNTFWKDIPPNDREEIIQFSLNILIGFQVLLPHEELSLKTAIMESVTGNSNLLDAIIFIHSALLTSPEFLIF